MNRRSFLTASVIAGAGSLLLPQIAATKDSVQDRRAGYGVFTFEGISFYPYRDIEYTTSAPVYKVAPGQYRATFTVGKDIPEGTYNGVSVEMGTYRDYVVFMRVGLVVMEYDILSLLINVFPSSYDPFNTDFSIDTFDLTL